MRDDMPPPAVRGRGSPPSAARVLQRLQGVRSAEQARQLLPLLPRLAEDYPQDHRIQRALSETALRAASLEQAVDRARAARALRPEDFGHRLHLAICLLAAGQQQEAASNSLRRSGTGPRVGARGVAAGQACWSGICGTEEAAECYERAPLWNPGMRGTSSVSRQPIVFWAGWMKRSLPVTGRSPSIRRSMRPISCARICARRPRRTTTWMRWKRCSQTRAPYMGEVMLCHALAKECEDLGDHARSFRYLARGAALRRGT
jgi:tetratricopeptide (TPR) repeat protein